MTTYDESFKKRTKNYIYAQETYPNVMKNEFQITLSICDLKPYDKFVNIPADNGLIRKKYLDDTICYIPMEINELFHRITGYILCELNRLPLENKSVDKILTLASLHHFDINDRKKYYNEVKRVLKSNGIFVIGDIVKNSSQEHFLNEFVNNFNSQGHKGIFFSPDDKKLLEKCGFKVEIEYQTYPWKFNSIYEMCDYCKNLFGLDLIKKDEDIINGIKTYLDFYENDDGSCYFMWNLIYFKSTISQK